MKGKTLAVALGISMVISAAGTSPAFAASKGDELQNKIDSLHNKQDKKKQETKEKKEQLQEVKEKKEQTVQEAQKLDSQIDTTQGKIDDKQSSISETKDEISKLKEKIKETKKRIKKRNKVLKERVQTMYTNGGAVNYVSVILGSQNFSDFLDRVMALSMITQQDKKLLEAQKKDKESLEEDRAKVEEQLSNLQGQLDELKDLKAQLNEKKQRKNELVKKLKMKENEVHGEVMDAKEVQENLAAQEATFNKMLSDWKAEQKRKAEERKRREEAKAKAKAEAQTMSTESSGGGNGSSNHDNSSAIFSWPANGIITSGYGWRKFGGGENHPGIDIAANGYVPIHAAASGTVIRSYLSSSYGNCVMIAHVINGQTYTTVYAHMRSRKVSQGQHVSRKQQVGVMGSTGHSTGQHLHFEIYKGGWTASHNGTVNPLSYLP